MKSSHKMVVTGAFGGLAAALVAGSGAFACTADATVGVVETYSNGLTGWPEKPVVSAGQTITVAVKSFQEGSDVIIKWADPYTDVETTLARLSGPSYTASFTIPADAYNSLHDQPYLLLASQTGTYSRSREVYLKGGRDWVEPQAQPVTPAVGTSPTAAPAPAANLGTGSNATGPSAPQVAAAAPAKTAGPLADTVAAVNPTPRNDRAEAAAAAVTSPVQAVPTPIPAGPPAPLENTGPPAAELWSGLKADGSVNLLEPASGMTSPSSGVPASGIALLGLGMLSMAGAAFGATRRRLAPSKVARRR